MNKYKKGFTLIELIVTIAVLGTLVLLASPRFFGHTQKAELTKGFANAKSIEKASELYYMDHEDWPRLTDDPYTSEEIKSYSERIFDNTGHEVNLDTEGNYYDIDYDKLSDYVNVPDDKKNYILQNPVGKIYYMEGLTEEGETRGEIIEREFIYKKYNLKIRDYYLLQTVMEERCFSSKAYGSNNNFFADGYLFDTTTGEVRRSAKNYSSVNYEKSHFYEFNSGVKYFLEYTKTGMKYYGNYAPSACYDIKKHTSTPNYMDSYGEYIEDIVVDNNITYPENGVMGNFWYILQK